MTAELKAAGDFPWQPRSFVTGNLAIGNLRNNLLARLKGDKGVHAETLLVVIGAIAGFAAQNAALIRGADATKHAGSVPNGSIVAVGTKDGVPFLFGDWINGYLVNETSSQFTPLHGFAAGSAIQAGAKAENLPSIQDMFRHAASTVGTSEFGEVRVPPQHTPAMQPIQALQTGGWRLTREIFSLKPPAPIPDEPPLEEVHWPIVASVVAGQFITQTKDVVSPVLAYGLVMESAIVASKVFPTAIEPGIWTIEAQDGKLAIRRNTHPGS